MIDLQTSFEWFDLPPPRTPDGIREIPRKLLDLWAEVREVVGPARFDSTLGALRPGQQFRRADDNAWVQTHAEKDESTVNLTIELYASELTLNLVGYYDGQFDKVRAWVGKRSGRQFLRAHPDLELVIFVRTAPEGKGGEIMWSGAPSEERERIDLGSESPLTISTRLTTLARQIDPERQKLSLHVRRSWGREETLAMSDVSETVTLVEDWIDEIGAVEVGD